jgi:hypothetical protein
MKTTKEILSAIRKQGFQVCCGEVLSKNGKQVLGEMTNGYVSGLVSRFEEGVRYTVEDKVGEEMVRWTIDCEKGEPKPNYKVVRRVLIHNHLANA